MYTPMLKRISLLLLLLCLSTLHADAGPRVQQVRQGNAPEIASYRMEVRLDPAAKTVAGSERITYRNPSQDTLGELWLRLYLKAFSAPDTIWMQESRGGMRGFNADPDNLGDITV